MYEYEEIPAKKVLHKNRYPEDCYGAKYLFNIYRGCNHGCIYCESRCWCYKIEDFGAIKVKQNAIPLLKEEFSKICTKHLIGTGSVSDPYNPLEKNLKLTRQALQVIYDNQHPAIVFTKSDLVKRDADILSDIDRIFAAVVFSINSFDDSTGLRIEPHAPPPSKRFAAIRHLSAAGILCGIEISPLLPYIQDSLGNVSGIVSRAADSGAKFVNISTGVTLKDRQKEYFFKQLGKIYPSLVKKYKDTITEDGYCPMPDEKRILQHFIKCCKSYGIACNITGFTGLEEQGEQIEMQL